MNAFSVLTIVEPDASPYLNKKSSVQSFLFDPFHRKVESPVVPTVASYKSFS